MDSHDTSLCYLPDEAATLALAGRFARALTPGLVIHLHGDLGAGKTTFTRGLLQGLGYQGKVKSPTYTLVETYSLPALTLHHFDLYRFADPEEWEDAGFRDYFAADTVCLVEWPDKAQGLLPPPDLILALEVADSGRHYRFTALSEAGKTCLTRHSTPPAADC
ncbi:MULTISPECIES: tRNA (adenosine(37)-N6)-threonylcarbamoyltransferase complex ATPase subunit type 1 TsaE [unclassified Paludibacterium]|uniref:tRNA (adenosine(37)-N6)-threonylcarbamoyltransferase complex ATPase subunit type 1 TsaE n=1 Tax=unclassified Paludibacterium TaxID=2618429 RepID=UPI001C04EF33|nr:tRNA (adenosine(37)-N6)-threonylcarbamoyltransferase complex ATPase subunit type 1 TsaE [Paludibacterium sp. B53371]BEV73351.1 tRNA (adenosine(37)-N6)-threonylcarbamoyltransferase complex ATPase subunit type 1 TsaE [Paludibacterium sp. THUN1379]